MIYGTARDRNISRLLRYLRRWPVFPLCGNALWQPVHVDDVAAAIVAVLGSPTTVAPRLQRPRRRADPFADLVRTAARAVGRRRLLLVPVPLRAAVLAARLTRVVSPEQVQRLAEDKAFDYSDAARDFAYAPRTSTRRVAAEARASLTARGPERAAEMPRAVSAVASPVAGKSSTGSDAVRPTTSTAAIRRPRAL